MCGKPKQPTGIYRVCGSSLVSLFVCLFCFVFLFVCFCLFGFLWLLIRLIPLEPQLLFFFPLENGKRIYSLLMSWEVQMR